MRRDPIAPEPRPSGKQPKPTPRWKVNWPALAVIAVIVAVLALISPIAGLVGFLLICLGLVAGNAGTGQWIPGSIGDDTNAAIPRRSSRRPPGDY
ncbi:MAG: hypothetical protein QOH13_1933 [Thermoleophilaceae bacterium]|jgi:hypothetical protein|nr:hypothetical protein [Thermoleophilaceae bacterium]